MVSVFLCGRLIVLDDVLNVLAPYLVDFLCVMPNPTVNHWKGVVLGDGSCVGGIVVLICVDFFVWVGVVVCEGVFW